MGTVPPVATGSRAESFAGIASVHQHQGQTSLHGRRRIALHCALIVSLLNLASSGRGQEAAEVANAPGDERPATAESPTFIFMNGPFDLESIWKRLNKPDFVILNGAEYQKLLDAGKEKGLLPSASRVGIESVEVAGEVVGNQAQLTVKYVVSVEGAGPHTVPIRLDGQVVRDVRELDRPCEQRAGAEGGWQVEVSGAGRHRLIATLLVPIKSTADGQKIDLAIPEAAATRVRLDVPGNIVEALAGPKEPLSLRPISDGRRAMLEANLAARSRLEVTWRVASDTANQGPPVLSALGEIAVEIDRGTFRTRSVWSIRSERGTAKSLEFRVDPAEELLGLELDDQPVSIEGKRDTSTGVVNVPLAEPLRLGTQRRLTMTTRRTLPAGVSTRLVFSGFPLANAIEQSGVIAVVQGGDLWISGNVGRGLRRIDPRSELPAALRARPSTVYAFQFVEQPFDLGLRVDPSPPSVRVAARTSLAIERGTARIDADLDYHVIRGRVYEVRVGFPKDLEMESVGPDSVIGDSHWLSEPQAQGGASDRVLVLRLTPKAYDDGTFRIHLSARQAIEPSAPVLVSLFQPRDVAARSSKVAILATRGVGVDLGTDDPGAPAGNWAEMPLSELPSDWALPTERSGLATVTYLRQEDCPASIPLRVSVRPRTVHHETTITANVARGQIDARQVSTVQVRQGTLSRVDISIPPSVEGKWELEGDEIAARERLGAGRDGAIHYRLKFRRDVSDTVRLRFRYRLSLRSSMATDRLSPLAIPWIKIDEGTASPTSVRISADNGIEMRGDRKTWTRLTSDAADALHLEAAREWWTWSGDDATTAAPTIDARALDRVSLPQLVASRLWLDTIQSPDGALRTLAWYRVESHEGSFSASLPAGSVLVRAWVGNEASTSVERLSRSGGYRIALPAVDTEPILVGLEFTARSAGKTAAWAAPRLEDGGVVQETLWNVRVPWNRALIGTPTGWSDENQWYWDVYVWRRRPWRAERDLTGWIGAANAGLRGFGNADPVKRGNYHSYLFGFLGEPAPLQPTITSRVLLMAVCSGLVLLLGIALLVWKPSSRLVWVAGILLAGALATAIDTDVMFVAVQSSLVGFALCAVAALTQRFVERRQPRPPMYQETSGLTREDTRSGSSRNMAPVVGSDASTVIRTRNASTLDHVATTPEPAPAERNG